MRLASIFFYKYGKLSVAKYNKYMSKYISGIYSANALISAAGVAIMYGGISTDGVNAFTFPTIAGTSGYTLTSDGSGGTSWASVVTSVSASVPAFLSITGSPITSSGTLAIGLSGVALPVTSGGLGVTTLTTNVILVGNGTGGVLSPAALTYSSSTLTLPKLISNDTTASISNVTGAMLLSGGLGIANTTDATSATNGGGLTCAGGGAFAKSLWVGTTLTATSLAGTITTAAQPNITSLGILPLLTLTNDGTNVPLLINMTNTNSLAIMSRMLAASLNTGFDCETWLGVSASNYNCMIMRFNYVAATQNTNYIDLGFYGANNLFQLYGSGVVKITTNIASTSSTTGVLTLVGGLGIANTTDTSSVTNGGGLTCAGGGAFAKSLWIGGTMNAVGLNISTPTGTPVLNMYAPGLGNGGDVELRIGVTSSNFNCGIIEFNYAGAGATGSGGNNVGIGFWGANNIVQINTLGEIINGALNVNGGSGNVPVYFNVTGTGSVEILRMWAPSLGNGNNCQFTFGAGASSLNCGVIQQNYFGSNNTGNNVGIGMYAANNVLQVYNNSVKVTNTANSGNPFIFNLVAPNMATGTYMEMHIGVAENNYNTGIINFNYVAAGANGPNGNSLGLGMYGGLNLMQLYNNSVKINGPLTVINASGSGATTNMFTPGLGNGGDVEFHIGVADAGLNCGIIQFNYVSQGAAGNTGNNVGIGMYGANNMIQVYSNGIKINGALAKNSGTFDIPHPDPAKQKQGYHLRHSFVESNTRGDNIYRYTTMTSGCKAEIKLPDYFKYLNENPQVIVVPVDILGIGRGLVDDELENVHIETSMDGTYNVLIIGTRKDKLAVEQFDPLGIEYVKD
jgi:hypothetical protein